MTVSKIRLTFVSCALMLSSSITAYANGTFFDQRALGASAIQSMTGYIPTDYSQTTFQENTQNLFKYALNDFHAGNFADASRNLHDILVTHPNDPYANYYMGLTKSELGNHRKAIKHLMVSKTYFPNDPQVYSALGSSFAAEGKHDEARLVLDDLEHLSTICANICETASDIDIAKNNIENALLK